MNTITIELPELTGTDKQISFGTTIRAEAFADYGAQMLLSDVEADTRAKIISYFCTGEWLEAATWIRTRGENTISRFGMMYCRKNGIVI